MISATANLSGSISVTAQLKSTQTGGCAPATIEVNSTPIDTVASGGVYNQEIEDSGGNPVGTAANPSVVGDATVQNDPTTPTWSDTVEAEGVLTLPQLKVLDSDGVTPILANYIPETDGFAATCSAATGGATLQVNLSTSTPNYKDPVTITVTPTGITPTSYTFIVPKDDGSYTRITQASNVLVWAAVYTGAQKISVEATDGVLFAVGETTVTVTWAFGKALSFNGTTQTAQLATNTSGSIFNRNTFCISYWININSYTNQPIVMSDNAFYLWHQNATNLSIGTGVFTVNMPTGVWHHVLINRLTSSWQVYYNGILATGSSAASNPSLLLTTLFIASYTVNSYMLNGLIDEMFVIQNFNPSAGQVLAYYNSKNGSHPSVLGRMPTWRISFDDTVVDETGNNVGLSLVNSPSYVAH